jgi:hypothetical protein
MKTGGALYVNKDTFSFLTPFYVEKIISAIIVGHGIS